MAQMKFCLESYPIALRWPHALRQPLERAAAMSGQSIAEFVESSVLLALANAGPAPGGALDGPLAGSK